MLLHNTKKMQNTPPKKPNEFHTPNQVEFIMMEKLAQADIVKQRITLKSVWPQINISSHIKVNQYIEIRESKKLRVFHSSTVHFLWHLARPLCTTNHVIFRLGSLEPFFNI